MNAGSNPAPRSDLFQKEGDITELECDGYRLIIFDFPNYDPNNENLDVEVIFSSGERYGATLFTLRNIAQLMENHRNSGECNHGQYFWAADMVIVRDLTHQTIREVIDYLIKEGELTIRFAHYSDDIED